MKLFSTRIVVLLLVLCMVFPVSAFAEQGSQPNTTTKTESVTSESDSSVEEGYKESKTQESESEKDSPQKDEGKSYESEFIEDVTTETPSDASKLGSSAKKQSENDEDDNSYWHYQYYNESTQQFELREIPDDAIRYSRLMEEAQGASVDEIGEYREHTTYVLDKDYVNHDTALRIKGDVSLILMDGCTMEVYTVRVDYPFSIRIYSQENGTGTLTANNDWHFYNQSEPGCAGIGGFGSGRFSVLERNAGEVYIYGGKITAKGGPHAAGIGGSGTRKENACAGHITIRGGEINAIGGSGHSGGCGAGIGGGSDGNATDITISGGTIHASSTQSISYECAAAIGCGGSEDFFAGGNTGGAFENITISGGTITAESSGYAAAIGGVYITDRGARNITITGGHIIANADVNRNGNEKECATAIGGGGKSKDINISISGRDTEITAIGAGDTAIGNPGDKSNITITDYLECRAGRNLNNLNYYDDPVNAVKNNKVAILRLYDADRDIVYSDENGINQTHHGYCGLSTLLSPDELRYWNSRNNPTKWYVVKDQLDIPSRIEVDGDITLVLSDGCELNVPQGLWINENSSLTIYGQSAQSGKLSSVDKSEWDNPIVIGKDGLLSINGGKFNVQTADNGKPFYIYYGKLTLNRGEVTARSSSYVFTSTQGTLTFNGGNITAETKDDNIFSISGGELNINGGKIATNGSSLSVIKAKDLKLKMTGGEFSARTSSQSVIDMESGEITISGGEFSASTSSSPVIHKKGTNITISSDLVCYAGNNTDNMTYYPDAVSALCTNSIGTLRPSSSYEWITYSDENGTDQTRPGYCALNKKLSDDKLCKWNPKNNPFRWYTVKGRLDISDPILVSGNITLVLQDDCELHIRQGLRIDKNSSLTIYAQTNQSGNLICAESSGSVYIGGELSVNGGIISAPDTDENTFDIHQGEFIVNRGRITAVHSDSSPFKLYQGKLIFNGGTITATNSNSSPFELNQGELAFNGGKITVSGSNAPAIHNQRTNITVSSNLQCFAGSSLDNLTHSSNPVGALCTNNAAILLPSGSDEILSYSDADGNDRVHLGCCMLDARLTRYELCDWNPQNNPTRWYAVKGNLVIPNEIVVEGDITLVLMDGCELNTRGILIKKNSSLTIYGQTNQSGKLTYVGKYDWLEVDRGGVLSVNGGKINAQISDTESFRGAAFKINNGGEMIVNRGEVTANTELSAFYSFKGKLTINGGYISASSTRAPVVNFNKGTVTVSSKLVCFAGSDMDNLMFFSDPVNALCTNKAVKLFPIITYEKIVYSDENGTDQTHSGYCSLINGLSHDQLCNWNPQINSTKWYVVKGRLDISDPIIVSGNITLVLEDGCELIAEQGLQISENSSLTIYAQTAQSGKLTSAGFNFGGATLLVNGGVITAQESDKFTFDGYQGELIINRGEITAHNSDVSLFELYQGKLTINGGKITVSASNAPVINKQGTSITISSNLRCFAGSDINNLTYSPDSVKALCTNNAAILLPAGSGEIVPYVDENGSNQIHLGYRTLNSETPPEEFMLGWNPQNNPTKWYVIEDQLMIPNPIEVSGNITLVLKDDCELKMLGGLKIAKDSSLTIYGQTAQSGILSYVNESAATLNIDDGSLYINGGNINVQISDESAYAFWIDSGELVINRGEINASTSDDSVFRLGNGKLIINGGEISASSSRRPVVYSAYETENIMVSSNLRCYAGNDMDNLIYRSDPANALCTCKAVRLLSSDPFERGKIIENPDLKGFAQAQKDDRIVSAGITKNNSAGITKNNNTGITKNNSTNVWIIVAALGGLAIVIASLVLYRKRKR